VNHRPPIIMKTKCDRSHEPSGMARGRSGTLARAAEISGEHQFAATLGHASAKPNRGGGAHAGSAHAGTPNVARARVDCRVAVGFGRNERQQTAGKGPRQKPAACLCCHGRQEGRMRLIPRQPGQELARSQDFNAKGLLQNQEILVFRHDHLRATGQST